MQKKIAIFLRNFLIFWVFIDIMPGIDALHGNAGIIIAALSYALLVILIPTVCHFFKFPLNIWSRLLFGSVLTIGLLLLFRSVLLGFIDFSTGYIGGMDLIFVTVPVLITLNSEVIVIIFGAIIVNLCSIIAASLSNSEI
ncbi:MAG: hypothetical protein WCJ58_06365 [bacterium]